MACKSRRDELLRRTGSWGCSETYLFRGGIENLSYFDYARAEFARIPAVDDPQYHDEMRLHIIGARIKAGGLVPFE